MLKRVHDNRKVSENVAKGGAAAEVRQELWYDGMPRAATTMGRRIIT